jgi:hypothetical protein
MTYDWEGQRTRRIRITRLVSAVAVGLVVPLLLTAWVAHTL